MYGIHFRSAAVARTRFRLAFITVPFLLISVWALTQSFAQSPRGGPNAPDIEIADQFDKDEDGLLNTEERAEARKHLASNGSGRGFGGPPGRGPGGRGGFGRGNAEEVKEGRELSPADVESFADSGLYDANVLRTLFLDFENPEWEAELQDFKPTDVEVPCTLTVDGKKYPMVGASFRGASSFFMIPAGQKRSLNLSIDYADEDQRLYGYKTLNLLNCNGDASLMSSFLYSHIAGQKIATPKVNFVRVVINGRSWGIYANAQQFNKDFLKENYDSKKGNRWKVNGKPGADAGLRYMGEELEAYKAKYEIKSKDNEEAWTDLITLCKTIDETPAEQIKEKLDPILDIDGALWFLAVDVALVNSDGYWTRASDYSIYQNKKGVFHVLPHDMNESFAGSHGGGPGGGPGGRGGPGGPGRGGPPGGFDPFDFFFGPGPGGQGPGGERPEGGRGGPGQRPEGDSGGPGQRPEGQADGPGQRPENGRGGSEGQQNQEQGFGGRDRGRGGFGGRGRGGPGGGFGGRGGPGGGRGGPGGGRGGPGGGGHGSVTLDPLVGLENYQTPLRSKLLANPELKEQYLRYVKQIATDLLDWNQIGPQIAAARELIQDEVELDTRKLMTYDAFLQATDATDGDLREFCESRAKFLLEHEAIQALSDQ